MYLIDKREFRFTDLLNVVKYRKRFFKKKVEPKHLDWLKVKDYIEKHKDGLESIYVGLAQDWYSTSDIVWDREQGYIAEGESWAFTTSDWAVPCFEVFYVGGGSHTFECWTYENNKKQFYN